MFILVEIVVAVYQEVEQVNVLVILLKVKVVGPQQLVPPDHQSVGFLADLGRNGLSNEADQLSIVEPLVALLYLPDGL